MLHKHHHAFPIIALGVVFFFIAFLLTRGPGSAQEFPTGIYGIDEYAERISCFLEEGDNIKEYELVKQWNWKDIDTVAIHQQTGEIYTSYTDSQGVKIKRHSPEGNLIKEWASGMRDAHNPIAVNSNGEVYITGGGSSLAGDNNYVRKFSSDGEFLLGWGSYGYEDGEFLIPWSITIDSLGYVYVFDNLRNSKGRIQKFTPDGDFVLSWEIEVGISLTRANAAIDADLSNNNVYVIPLIKGGLFRFSPEGQLIEEFPEVVGDVAIAVMHNNLFTGRVYKYDLEGNFITKFESGGGHSVDVDQDGCIYVVDYEDSLRKFCPNIENICSKITVIKDVVNSPDPQDFTFGVSGNSLFRLDDDNNPTLSNKKTFLMPKAEQGETDIYTVLELNSGLDSGNWSLDSIDCVDPTGDTETYIFDPAGSFAWGQADVRISGTEEVICTFRNVNESLGGKGKVVVRKEFFGAPTPTEGFLFQASFGNNFILNPNNSMEFLLPPSDPNSPYEIREVLPSSYGLQNLFCWDPTWDTTVSMEDKTAYVDLSPNEIVYCTFSNSYRNEPIR